jgi:hypothetical protein
VEYECAACGAFYTEQYDLSDEQTDKPSKRQKFNNQPVQYDGIQFASLVEGLRYLQLKRLQEAGLIRNLKPHPPYTIFEGGRDNEGRAINKIEYEADFSYYDTQLQKTVIEDVKGAETAAFRMKWKLLRYKFRNDRSVKLVKLPAREV